MLDLLDNLVDIFGASVNEKELIFDINISPEVKLLRVGDSLRLSQVLINLIGNAIKFTKTGFIQLTIESPLKNTLLFKVEDSGIGIPVDKRDSIFSSFTQADDTTTRKYGGSGLGLSICQQLVSLMDGWIKVDGEHGVGSCFSFQVKVKESDKSNKNNYNFPDANVLIISDEEHQRIAWKNFFKLIDVPLTIKYSKDVAKGSTKQNDLVRAISHVFIDDVTQNHHEQDVLDNIKAMIGPNIPCFLLCHLSPHVSELPTLSENVQLLSKPIKMGDILTTIRPPLDESEKTGRIVPNSLNISEKLKGCRALLVEDNIINQQVAKGILKKSGVVVTIVENGKLAVEACEKEEFDIVLMDMHMPVMDGYQASQLIRKQFSSAQLPIIAMTANVMEGDKEKCLKFGMDDYIGKPVNRAKLIKMIEGFLDKKQ